MPPKGRKSGGAMPSPSTRSSARQHQQAQSTLSFNQRKSKVTKPSISTPLADKKAPSSKLNHAAEAEILNQLEGQESQDKPQIAEIRVDSELPDAYQRNEDVVEDNKPITSTSSHTKKKKLRTSIGGTVATKDEHQSIEAAVKEAGNISTSRVNRYWKAEEDARLAPRINQSDLSIHEKILRHFDLSSQYGPCIGIPRLTRWTRAYSLSLAPPIEVLAVLLKEEKLGSDRGMGQRKCGAMAYVDELAGGRSTALVE